MIKLIAALTMLIDHIGVVFFPGVGVYRIIGRLSMPLYAYCIARGFAYSKQHGTEKKYILNMLLLALFSQVPFCLMGGSGWNICFTWTFSLLLLTAATQKFNATWKRVLSIMITALAIFMHLRFNIFPVDYGLYGVFMPLLFYYLIVNDKESTMSYLFVLLIAWAWYVLRRQSTGSLMQIVSILSAFILTVGKRFDHKVKLPKWVYYSFYPVHMSVLMMIRWLSII